MDARSEVANGGPYRTPAVMPKAPKKSRGLTYAGRMLVYPVANLVFQGLLNLSWFVADARPFNGFLALFMFASAIGFGRFVNRLREGDDYEQL